MSTYLSFDRQHLRSVLQDLAIQFPGVVARRASLTWTQIGHKKHYSFRYDRFAWDGVAENAYAARAKAWSHFMNRQDTLAA